MRRLLNQVDGICQLITKLPPLPREPGPALADPVYDRHGLGPR